MCKQLDITLNEAIQRKQSICRSLDNNSMLLTDTMINLMLGELLTLKKLIDALQERDN